MIFSPDQFSVRSQLSRSKLVWLAWYCGLLGAAGLLGLWMARVGPKPVWLAWVIYLTGLGLILYRPRYGLYLLLTLSLVGDGILTPWFPFAKNFSSRESLLYVHDSIIISPLELYLAAVFVSWLLRLALSRKLGFYKGPLFWPGVVFTGFIAAGLGYGILTGGNVNIALWEARPIFYLIGMLLLVTNLIENRGQLLNLIWAVVLGLLVEALIGDYYFLVTLKGSLAGVEAITEHAAAVHMNLVFVLGIALWLYRSQIAARISLTLIMPVVGLAYLATQRRAAFVALAIALILVLIVLFRINRRLLLWIAPPLLVISLLYLAVFWNASGAVALPAQAIKSVVAENQASQSDQASNYYRVLENINTSFTIHQQPLTGVGFGQKFYVIVPMPDISFFAWWQYFPHNSIIWFWLKTGAGGFISMLFLVGLALMTGAQLLVRMPPNELSAALLTACLYLVMHFVFAYVDIAWDAQSTLLIGALLGFINCAERVVAQEIPLPPKRWPWLPDPVPAPGLSPAGDDR